MICPLCRNPDILKHFDLKVKQGNSRTYFQCQKCEIVYLDPEFHLSPVKEKAVYDCHNNSPENDGYVRFLKRLADPLSLKLSKHSSGLDFGCGPGPTMQSILADKGFNVCNYDPFYFPDRNLLKNKYDFVTCTEVIEHFYNPYKEFLRINRLLKKKGSYLGLMTQLLPEGMNFKDWWYLRDPTHVVIYSERTFMWISKWMGWKIEIPENGVVIYAK